MTSDPNAAPTASGRNLEQERDELLRTVRELTHLQLIARDTELGLRAELLQTRIDLAHAEARTEQVATDLRRSSTWRVGRIVTKPIGAGRRAFRKTK